MTNYYPLTAAQKMHHNWIMDYGTQQVSGVSVVASVQAELDFGLLSELVIEELQTKAQEKKYRDHPAKAGRFIYERRPDIDFAYDDEFNNQCHQLRKNKWTYPCYPEGRK